MGAPRMRPPFRLQLPVPGAALMSEIEARLANPDALLVGSVLRRHVELTVLERDRHFWSPHLTVDVLDDEGATVLRGRFGPHPHVWTMVMGVYGVLALVAMFSAVFGLSQWNLGWQPWAMWGIPVAAIAGGLLWLSSLAGQRAAYPQMQALEHFFRDCVARVSSAPPADPEATVTVEASER